jgi:hypothetical protein
MKHFNLFLFGLFCLFVASCNNNSSAPKNADLNGTWICIDALLDGEKNDLMIKDESKQNPGAVIEISESVLRFDLLSELKMKKEHNYKLEADKIISTVDPELIFTIKKLEADNMTLSFNAEGMNFELIMKKQR